MNLDPKALEAAAKALFDSVFDKLDWHKVEYQELYRKHAKSAITAYLTAAEKAVDGAAVVSGSPVSVGDEPNCEAACAAALQTSDAVMSAEEFAAYLQHAILYPVANYNQSQAISMIEQRDREITRELVECLKGFVGQDCGECCADARTLIQKHEDK